jgi:hypothetical protein
MATPPKQDTAPIVEPALSYAAMGLHVFSILAGPREQATAGEIPRRFGDNAWVCSLEELPARPRHCLPAVLPARVDQAAPVCTTPASTGAPEAPSAETPEAPSMRAPQAGAHRKQRRRAHRKHRQRVAGTIGGGRVVSGAAAAGHRGRSRLARPMAGPMSSWWRRFTVWAARWPSGRSSGSRRRLAPSQAPGRPGRMDRPSAANG